MALVVGVVLIAGAALLGAAIAIWEGGTPQVHASAPAGLAARYGSLPGEGSLATFVVRITGLVHASDSHQLLVAGGAAFVIMLVLSLALGWPLAGRFLAPLRTITATTRRISASNLHERLNLTGPEDELKELADTFDQLLDRLERAFSFERRFVANASHELRTPLAAMRMSLDVATAKPRLTPAHVRTLVARLGLELDHVDRLLESFLTLAQTQEAPPADKATISLGELTRRAIEQHREAIARLGLDVRQAEDPGTWVRGSKTLLSRMVENVIDNAIAHNQPGGWVRVSPSVDAGRARLVIASGGPPLDPEQVKQLAQPFRRIAAERTGSDKGTGLGLSIVAAIAESHGGTLELEARKEGGLRVAITLPLAAGGPE